MIEMNGKKRLIIVFFVLILMLFLTACTKQPAQQPVVSSPEIITDNKNNQDSTAYQGKIKESRDFLIDHGINPVTVVTEETDGKETVISWENLCMDEQSIMLDSFLNKQIGNISSEAGYSPVKLRSVVFVLEDNETAVEIFFYNDKIMGGITYPKMQISEQKKDYRSLKGESLAQIRQLDYPIWQPDQDLKQPGIYYLQTDQALKDGFEKAVQVQSLGQGRVLIAFFNELKNEKRVYVYDTMDGSDFYTNISLDNEYGIIKAKQLQDNQTAVFLEHKVLIVESKSFKVLEEIQYPNELEIRVDDLDISFDGTMIAYANKKGLFVCNNRFQNSKILVESKIGKDPHGQDWEVPRYPVFSPDSKRILYRIVGYEWLVGTGTLSLDGTEHEYFKTDSDEKTFSRWYGNQHIYSNGPAYGEFSNPVLYDIETQEETYLIQDNPRDQRYSYFLGEDSQLFYQKTKIDENDILEFGYYEMNNNTWHEIMKIPGLYQLDLHKDSYDPVHKTFVFILNNYPISSKPAIMVGIGK